MRRGDMAVAHVLANHRSVFGLHQTVVIAVPRSRFGLLDQQLVQQFGHGVIDELAAVVGMKTANHERETAASIASSTGISQASLICAVAPTTCHCVTSSTALM